MGCSTGKCKWLNSETESLTGAAGTKTRAEARGLAGKLKDFSFTVLIVFWFDILFQINMTSKVLQGVQTDLFNAVQQLGHTKNYLQEMRSEDGFSTVASKAKELAESLDILPSFPQENPVRSRRRKKMFECE